MPNALGHQEMKNAADNMMLQHTTFISDIFTVHVLTNHFSPPVVVTQQCIGETQWLILWQWWWQLKNRLYLYMWSIRYLQLPVIISDILKCLLKSQAPAPPFTQQYLLNWLQLACMSTLQILSSCHPTNYLEKANPCQRTVDVILRHMWLMDTSKDVTTHTCHASEFFFCSINRKLNSN
jgi:hypothetical protein